MQDRPAFIGRFFLCLYSSIPPKKKRHTGQLRPSQKYICDGFSIRILSQALSGFLSGFYLCRMIYRPAIKKPFAGVLEAWQEYGSDIPAMAAGEGAGKVSGS